MLRNKTFADIFASLVVSLVVVTAQVGGGVPTNNNNNNNNNNDPGCANGQCPLPTTQEDGNSHNKQDECGIWMGPSPVKLAEEHGFGLGLFTGRAIPKGTTVESLYGTAGEVILPLFGSQSIHQDHTPLREYVWDENTLPELAIAYPNTMTYQFIPGASSIIPCTAKNYNLDIYGDGKADTGRQSVVVDTTLHRARHATAGAVAQRRTAQFVAVRDIAAGEELTCRCTDDDFDGGVYELARYQADNQALFCVEGNVRVDTSTVPGAGQGLLAQRYLAKDAIIISTPLLPLHRDEMNVDENDDIPVPVNDKQLMLNYCYGHANSNLLLLPYGPLVNFINHYGGDDTTSRQPNARIQWHTVNTTTTTTTMTTPTMANLDRRQQHHHAEMFHFTGEHVASTHGVTFTMDIVATRDIAPGQEILLDYGSAWQQAWEAHVQQWKAATRAGTLLDPTYTVADAFLQSQQGGPDAPIRTMAEQLANPYPANIETFCYYSGGQVESEDWDDDDLHECFRPCNVLERRQTNNEDQVVYNVQFLEQDNDRILTECTIDGDYLLTNIPHRNVRIVDRPYTMDVFLKTAFRQEIGVPADFYPPRWMKQKLRSRKSAAGDDESRGEEFKRKMPSAATRGVVEIDVKAVE